MRTDASFVEVTVGDPEVADVNPLTDRALSILGKKIGTTRVSVYGEGKKLIGVFDVEVTYDISRMSAEIAPFARWRRQGDLGQRPHHALRHRARMQSTVDRAVVIARQFGPDVINTVQILQPQQVMLEVRFVGGIAAGRPRAGRSVERLRPERPRQYR